MTFKNFLRNSWNSFKNWWKSLGTQTPHPTISKATKNPLSGANPNTMLAQNRDEIAASLVLLIASYILGKTIAPYMGSYSVVIFSLTILKLRLRRDAIKDSRLARELFDQQINHLAYTTKRTILFLIAFSIIINQNVMGIGDAVTNTLPFMNKAAEYILRYINGFVRDFSNIWNFIKTVFSFVIIHLN